MDVQWKTSRKCMIFKTKYKISKLIIKELEKSNINYHRGDGKCDFKTTIETDISIRWHHS